MPVDIATVDHSSLRHGHITFDITTIEVAHTGDMIADIPAVYISFCGYAAINIPAVHFTARADTAADVSAVEAAAHIDATADIPRIRIASRAGNSLYIPRVQAAAGRRISRHISAYQVQIRNDILCRSIVMKRKAGHSLQRAPFDNVRTVKQYSPDMAVVGPWQLRRWLRRCL